MPLFDEKMSAENGFFFNPDVAIDLCYFERKPLRYVVRIHNLLVSFFSPQDSIKTIIRTSRRKKSRKERST